jgi:predicted NBD/HSP70 family sugar kinase
MLDTVAQIGHIRGVVRAVQKKNAVIADLEGQLIKCVRASDGISRIELSRTMGLSASTVGIYVERLLKDGYLVEGGKMTARRGRPRTVLNLNPGGGEFIGVDFYAGEILATAVNFAQAVVRQGRIPLTGRETADSALKKLAGAIAGVMPPRRRTVLSIGIGCPGPVNTETGVALDYPYIKGFHNVALVAPLQRRFRKPVYIDNTANALALAELWFGDGRDMTNFAAIWDRAGVGAGVVINRQIYRGLGDGAGEIGHTRCPVRVGTKRIAWKELDNVASVRAVLAALETQLGKGRASMLSTAPRPLRADAVVEAYQAGDRLARAAITDAVQHLGWALAHFSFAYAPEAIILGGPFAILQSAVVKPTFEIMRDLLKGTGLRPPRLLCSRLGPFSGALGAAALAVDKWKPNR